MSFRQGRPEGKEQEETRQEETRQETTRQEKTRQEETGQDEAEATLHDPVNNQKVSVSSKA